MTPADPAPLPRAFSHLAAANLAAQAAEQISLAAVPIVAVLLFAAGAREVGALAAVQSLPFLLLALPFGLWADRASRRRLMVSAEVLRVAAMLTLAVLTWAAGGAALSMVALGLLGFAGAVGTVAFSVSAPAMVPTLVPREAFARANGRLELARSLAFAAGPALAGSVVAAIGGGGAFALAAALSALAVWQLRHLPHDRAPADPAQPAGGTATATPPPLAATAALVTAPPTAPATTPPTAPPAATSPAPRPSLWAPVREGARFVWHDRWLRPMLLTAVVWNLSWMVLQAAYVPHAMQHLGLGARGVGLTLSLYGAGMVLGALGAPRLMARLPLGAAVVFGPVVSVGAAPTKTASLVWPHAALASLSFFLFGAGPIVWTVSTTTLRQSLTPGAMLGRVGSIFLTANAGARPLGAALGAGVAALAGEQGIAACLVLAAAGFVLQAMLVMASALRTLRTLPHSTAAHEVA